MTINLTKLRCKRRFSLCCGKITTNLEVFHKSIQLNVFGNEIFLLYKNQIIQSNKIYNQN